MRRNRLMENDTKTRDLYLVSSYGMMFRDIGAVL